MKDRFESVLKIAAVKAPVLIFHGQRDRTIPVKFGRQLFKAAAEPKESRWYEDASHNNLYDFGADDMVLDFLERRT
ncbi:MAG: alpha/beta hydrolase, partial [Rhodospirillales bacterium]